MGHVADRWHVVKDGRKIRSDRYGKGSRWQAVWLDPATRRECTKAFTIKVDAERFIVTVESDQARGSYVDPKAGQETVRSYGERHRAVQVHRPSTAEAVEIVLRCHVYPLLGDRRLSSVLPSDVKALVKGWSITAAPTTVETRYRILAAMFRAAVADRLIASSPCVGITLPRKSRPKVIPIETEAVRELEDALPARMRAMVTLAAGTGLRLGEVLGLTVDRVDFFRRTLTVDRQLSAQRPPQLAPPKTEASIRTIPLPAVVVEALAEHLRCFPAAADGLIFTNVKGAPYRRNTFNLAWAKAAKQVGTTATFHSLRHYYASLLIRHGESVKTVQSRLGHASAVETLDVYGHLWPDGDDRTREAVDAVLGGSLTDHTRTKRLGG